MSAGQLLSYFSTIEGASYYVNKTQGKKTAFLIARSTYDKKRHYGTLDPHLGYARWLSDDDKNRLKENNFEWVDGFVIYKKNKDRWTRPIILTLGGSTTDGVRHGHSWPEELSKLMTAEGLSGTVVNGGTGGYSSNQELLKLIRDGLEFKPNIVISYSGLNDLGKFNELPYPMVHPYQRYLLKYNAGISSPKYFPSTLSFLQRLLHSEEQMPSNITLGVKTHLSQSGQYLRNIDLMKIISESRKAKFFGFIQPCSYCKTHKFYKEVIPRSADLGYMTDATSILDGVDDAYKKDGVHLTLTGNKAVANFIYGKVKPFLNGPLGSQP